MRHRGAIAFTSASLLALVWAGAGAAAEAPTPKDESVLEELIVTAQKREQRVEDVPLAINVIGAEQLERQQVNNIFDLSRVSPALELTNAAGQNPGGGGSIRGLGTQSFGIGAVGSVGIVVDGVSQGNANITDLFDLGRVEVLKGPQGTLFGLTTSAGVINITTKAPDFTAFSARIRTELSDEGTAGSGYGQQVVQGSVNIPLGEIAGLRLAGNYNDRQGPNRNALDGSLDHHKSYGGRARLLLKPFEDLSINVNADYTKQTGDGPDFFTVYKADPGFTAQLANCRAAPGAPVTPVTVSSANRDYCTSNIITDGSKNYGGSVTVDYTLAPFTITSITAARRTRTAAGNTLDIFRLRNAFFVAPNLPTFPGFNPTRPIVPPQPTDITIVGASNPGPTSLVTQELRIASPSGAKFEYTAGYFYSNQSTQNFGGGGGGTTVADYPALGAPPIILSPPVPATRSSNQNFSNAAFGQATYHLTDQLGLIGGLRYTEEVLKQNTISVAGVITNSRVKNTNTSWRVGAQYKFDPTLNAYATYARGYKGAQFAAPICPVSPTNTTGVCPPGTPQREVKPEIPTNYEIGAKKVLFNGRAIADINAFYIEMKDFQGQVCITNAANLLTCTVTNFDGVKSRGIEGNLFGRISDNLTVNTGLIWNPAEFPKRDAAGGPFKGADGSILSGKQLQLAPIWKFTFSTEYTQEVFNGLEGFVGGDAVYKSKIRYAASTNPLLSYGSNIVLGLHGGIRSEKDKWQASLFVRNLTNEHIPVLRQAGFPFGQNYGQFLSTGSFRVVGVNLEAGF